MSHTEVCEIWNTQHAGCSEESYLNVMQHLSEDGALFPPVVLCSVFVAVCGQAFQTLT